MMPFKFLIEAEWARAVNQYNCWQLIRRAALIFCLGYTYAVALNGQGIPQETGPASPKTNESWSIHFQATTISQKHDFFGAFYSGPNSLARDEPFRTTYTGTLFLGAKLWRGAEVYVDPEVSGGKGLSGTLGVAGFPNGEATRVGDPAPTPYFARYFFRQRFDLGGGIETIEADQNQLAGERDRSSLTITVGKMAAGDLFDDNSYSHDPSTQFMNWALMANGAWDYPADTRGYTYGLSLELDLPQWNFRAGTFMVPTDANGGTFDKNFGRASGNALEIERDYRVGERPGKIKALGFANFANMGSYADAIAQSPAAPDVTLTRAYRVKYGFGLNWEQELTTNIGAFGRLGWNDGESETWMFTEIDRTASLGVSIKGACWGRKEDSVGLAGVVNEISKDHRRYLAPGGLGFIIGDGRINYAPEGIFEFYYSLRALRYFFITAGFQHVESPGYNADRGPANVGTLRLHCEF